MRTMKTSSKERSTYTYRFADGTKVTITPGEVSGGTVITEETIRILHRMDDNEVYNNVKNAKKPVEDWERPILEVWKEAHPYEDLPSRGFVSLDAVADYQDRDGDGEADKGTIMAELACRDNECVSPEIERLREVVEMLRPDQRELYRRIVLNGEPAVSVAAELGVDKSAITHRMDTIKKFIRKNY